MSRFMRKEYDSIVPYTPGEQLNDKKYIKLNTNESPFPASPKVLETINEKLISNLRLYSDPKLKNIKEAIAEFYGVSANQIFVGNGSDDVIAFAFMAFGGLGGDFCCPDITYSFYPVFADLFKVNLEQIPLKNDFSVDVNDYVNKGKNIIIANPNAPTGLALTHDEVELIVKANPDNVVIIDEAYVDFAPGVSAVDLVDKYENLMVTQTFSKSRSLAGLRVGFSVASKALTDDLEKLKYSFNPYNVNTLSVEAAAAAILDRKYYEDTISQTIEIREFTKNELIKRGFTVTDSKSNFVFAKTDKIPSSELYEELRNRGILIRYFNSPRINEYFRMSMGTMEQMKTVIEVIDEIIKERE